VRQKVEKIFFDEYLSESVIFRSRYLRDCCCIKLLSIFRFKRT